jgi:hypothetical protein
MDDHTDTYLDYIKSVMLQYQTAPYVVAEKKLDISSVAPDCFGTADCLICAGKTIHIIDFKYGKGVPVSADHNTQMMLYALGALREYQLIYGFENVQMTIVQPRLNNTSEFTLSVQQLLDWGENFVKPAAQKAFGDNGEFKPGEHCRFCRGKYQCKARAEYYASYKQKADESKDPRKITANDLGRYLKVAQQLKDWADDMASYALTCCLDGKEVPGWKAVRGRGNREFTDMDAAFNVLKANKYNEAILYERVPMTLAQAEKVVGPKKFNQLVGKFIVKKPGKPTLAPESDKREAVTNEPKAQDIFKNLEEE